MQTGVDSNSLHKTTGTHARVISPFTVVPYLVLLFQAPGSSDRNQRKIVFHVQFVLHADIVNYANIQECKCKIKVFSRDPC